MFRIHYSCCNCHDHGEVDDTATMCGQCPACGCHHGEVEYEARMSPKEFLEKLAQMSDSEIANNAYAIQLCAEQLSQEL